jgi:hypothetical protein
MSFSFGFSGDDVGDDNDVVGQNDSTSQNVEAQSQFIGLPAEEHSLDDLVGPLFALWFRSLLSLQWDLSLASWIIFECTTDRCSIRLA